MRGKRSKQYRKLMHAYQLAFSFREPYQVLLDAAIIKDAHRFKMRLGAMLENTLHGEIKPMITQCCIRHLYNEPASPDKDAWIEVAKQAERRRCGHHELEEPLSALECMESVVDPKGSGMNKHRYVVASQEQEVRAKMREVVGVPLVYINRSVMILEPMAERTERVKEGDEKAKIKAGLKSRRGAVSTGEKRKRDDGEDESASAEEAKADIETVQKKRKVKGPKGPNPLSVKKTKKPQDKPKSVTKQVKNAEDERTAIRKASKSDPQAAEKTRISGDVGDGQGADGSHKRKRKRGPKIEDAAATVASEA